MNVNPLTTRDLELAMEAATNLIDAGAMEYVMEMRDSDSDKSAIGMKVFSLLNKHAREPLVEILANARGESIEEFRQVQASDAVATINAIMEDAQNKGFFDMLAGMFNKIEA